MTYLSENTKKARSVWDEHFPKRLKAYGIKGRPGVFITTNIKAYTKAILRATPELEEMAYEGEVLRGMPAKEIKRTFVGTGGDLKIIEGSGHLTPKAQRILGEWYKRELATLLLKEKEISKASIIKMHRAMDPRYPVYITVSATKNNDELVQNIIAEGSHVIFGHVRSKLFEKPRMRYIDKISADEHALSETFDNLENHLAFPKNRKELHGNAAYMTRIYRDSTAKGRVLLGIPDIEPDLRGFALFHLIITRFGKDEKDVKMAASILLTKEFRNFEEAHDYFGKLSRNKLKEEGERARKILEKL